MCLNMYQVSTRVLCLCLCCSILGPGFVQTPTPALVRRRPALYSDPCLSSRPDPGLGLCQLPSPAQDLGPDLSSRPGPVQHELCPCLGSRSGPDWSVPLGPCQSSTPARGAAPFPGPRPRGLGPCWSSSSGPEAGTGPCLPLGSEATRPSPPALEAASLWAEPWSPGPPHWPGHLMTSQSSWWLGNPPFLWEHSGGPRT